MEKKLTKRDFEFLTAFNFCKEKEIKRVGCGYLYLAIDNVRIPIEDSMFLCIKPYESWSFDKLLTLEVE